MEGRAGPGDPEVMDTVTPSPLLTANEHRAYLDELNRLREVRDRDLPGLLREARTFVANDAAEEVIQIHEDQAVVNARIRSLTDLLRRASIVADDEAPHLVSLGRSVEVEYLPSGKVVTYHVAGVPAHHGDRTVSAASPIGAALIGRSAGDTVAVELPSGRIEHLRIVRVHAAADPAR
jgi:transcription elongation factor GreA